MTNGYDVIGHAYSARRRADPRLADAIASALGGDGSVLNVGAGTGSYEPARAAVVAADPSAVMLAQRPSGSAPAVQARAEALPFPDRAFDAVMAVLTLHHWNDKRRGLEECARVARHRVVILTWDPDVEGFWLVQDYFPEILTIDRRLFPRLETLTEMLGPLEVRPLPIPGDCVDGFLGAFWRRPEAYLDEAVRAGISTFSRLRSVNAPLARLRRDLASGRWEERYGALRSRDELDIGYRLVVAERFNR